MRFVCSPILYNLAWYILCSFPPIFSPIFFTDFFTNFFHRFFSQIFQPFFTDFYRFFTDFLTDFLTDFFTDFHQFFHRFFHRFFQYCVICVFRLQRWSFFDNDGMVMNILWGTIAIDGFSMVLLPLNHHHWMFFSPIDHCYWWFFNGFPKFWYDGQQWFWPIWKT